MAKTSRESLIQKTALGGAAFGLLGLIAISIVAMLIGMMASNYSLIYLSAAFMAPAIPLLAGVMRGRRFDMFEPINLVAFAIFFGTTLRAVWLLTSDDARVDFIMMGTTLEEVSRNAPAILLSVVAFTVGYLLTAVHIPLERITWVNEYRISRQRLWWAVWLFSLLSMLGIYLFIQKNDINLSNEILTQSFKRVQTYSNEEGESIYGAGYERFLGMLCHHALMLLASIAIIGVVKIRLSVVIAILIMLFLSISIPFLSSSRSTLLLLAINILIIMYYYGRLKISQVLVVSIIAIAIFSWLGALRVANQSEQPIRETSIATRVIGSGSSLDFVRTSAIIDRVPEVVDYQYGKSYLALVGAPIPREIWSEKPQVSLGGFVKGEIFGQPVRINGWPPGMIGEGWINFGYIGLIVPLFIFGMGLRIFYESFRTTLGFSFPLTLIYSVSIWRVGFGMVGSNFAQGIVQALFYLAPMVVILMIARAPKQRPSGVAAARGIA